MGSRWGRQSILVVVFAFLLTSAFSTSVLAQGLPQSPYSAPSVVRGGLDLAPSNPLGLPSGVGPRSSDSILLTPQLFHGILPQFSNLQFGYLYSFGDSVDSGRLTADYLVPMSLGRDTTIFGEAHGEFQNFWKTIQRTFTSGGTTTTLSGFNERTDLSFGGGYRTILNENTLLGVNGFFDTTKLGNRWYSSGSLGFEMAAALQGNDAIDLNFNWYGNLFQSNVLANAFRRGPQSFDFQAGYSHELWNGGPDLRLNVTGYRFSAGSGVYGLRGGAELKSRDGMFVLKYEAAHDRVNKTYHTVGGFVNVGLQLENLLSGENPLVMPEPIFKSPRNLRRLLTRKSKRNWHQPSIVIASSTSTTTSIAQCQTTTTSVNLGSFVQSGVLTLTRNTPLPLTLDPNAAITSRGLDIRFNMNTGGPVANFFWQISYVYEDGSESIDCNWAGTGSNENVTVSAATPPVADRGCITHIRQIWTSSVNCTVDTTIGLNQFRVPGP